MSEKLNRVTLREVAPPVQAEMPAENAVVWNLSLEDIESVSGRILTRATCRVSELGSTKCSFDQTHVLYSKLRPYLNKVVLPDKPGVGTSELIPLRPDPKRLDREYLAFYLRSPAFVQFATSVMQGANLPRVSMTELWNHRVALRALDRQRWLVARIKECLGRVEEMQRLREEAEREIAVLENAWLRQRLAELAFGWPQQELAAFADIRGGGSLPKGTATAGANGDWLLVKVGDMNLPGNELEIVSAREFLNAGVADDAWPVGTVVFPKRGGAIATNKKRLLGRPALLDPNLMGVIGDSKTMRPAFLVAQFAILDLTTLTSGSTVPQLNRKDLAPLPFVVPDLETQDAVISQAKEVSTRVRSMAKDMACRAELDALRESILREAFAGNL